MIDFELLKQAKKELTQENTLAVENEGINTTQSIDSESICEDESKKELEILACKVSKIYS